MSNFTLETLYLPFDFDQTERRVRIYLPQHYETSNKRYPVLYMHDGQNVFYDEESYSTMSWRVVEALKLNKLENKVIVVAIDHAGERRVDDYSPYKFDFPIENHDQIYTQGHGQEYADFIVNTLKPVIDETYPTLPQRKYTALCGSSLGGLITAYIAAEYNEVFKFYGVFSLASHFCETDFLNHIQSSSIRKKSLIYIQTGSDEGLDENNQGSKLISQQFINNSLYYQKALLLAGLHINNIKLHIHTQEIHREQYWAQHLPKFIGLFAQEMKLFD